MPEHLSSQSRSMTVENTHNHHRGHAPLSPQRQRRVFRNGGLALLLGSVLTGALPLPAPALAETKRLATPADARLHGLESLRLAVRQDGGVPLPENLDHFIKNREAAVQLGKAFFWDMQVGSDGVQACATCHFHAGADHRTKNNVNPGQAGGDNSFQLVPGANSTVTAANFPFHRVGNPDDRFSVVGDVNDVMGSQGVFDTEFLGLVHERAVELGNPIPDPVFHVGANNTRRVTGRNAPSVINAAFNYNNFWDGRANFIFNGVDPFGDANVNARIFTNDGTGALKGVQIHLENSSLASQAVGPPGNDVEMSYSHRTFPDIGRKLLRLRPLGRQLVHGADSVLGPAARRNGRWIRTGLNATYRD